MTKIPIKFHRTPPETPVERLTVTAPEAAKMIGVSERMIHQLVKEGKLPHKRIGRRLLFPVDAVRQFVNETTQSVSLQQN